MPLWRIEANMKGTAERKVWLQPFEATLSAHVRVQIQQKWDVLTLQRRPDVLIPDSPVARVLLIVFLVASGLYAFTGRGGFSGNGSRFALAVLAAVLAAATWWFLIAVVRYAFFVFPWERETRRLIDELERSQARQAAAGEAE